MEPEKIHERVQEIARELFDDPDLVLESTTGAETVEGWDSLSHVSLVIQLEQAFGIKFALGEMQSLRDVGEMLDLIKQKLH